MLIDKPILITGCARSGTSMTAGIIEMCGAFGGRTSPPNNSNKKGMFENVDIRNGIVKPYLSSIGADPMGQDPLPRMRRVYGSLKRADIFSTQWKEKVLKVLFRHGLDTDWPWYYKGAKMCLFWPVWYAAFPDARWVIVRRQREDIVNSCLKTGFMRAHRTEDGWMGWVKHHEEMFDQMRGAGLVVHEVWPQKAISGDFSEIRGVVDDLGLQWNNTKIIDFISPALWSRKKKG